MVFTSSNAVFSKNKVDFGSDLLLKTFVAKNKNVGGKLLDVGCGYGTFGLTLAAHNEDLKATMVDVNERAIELTLGNAQKNGVADRVEAFISNKLENVEGSYNYVVTNPPIRAGKDVVFGIYEGAYDHLDVNGEVYVVIQKKQGASSSIKKMEELFGNCEIIAKESGYLILLSVKK